jgi:phosphatidylglycerol lysyltransferase
MSRLEQLWLVNLRLNTQDYIGRRTGRIAIAIGQCVGATSLIAAAELALQRYGRKIWTQRRLLLSVLGCTKADLLCAGLVIALLAPPDLPLVLVLVLVLAVFLLAFGAGLASPVPMALGAFDLIVLVFLPAPVAAMLPAFLAFRLVYFVLPALCGGVAYWRPRALPGSDGLRQQLRLNTSAIWASSDQGATIWRDTNGAALVGHTLVAHVLIGYPVKTVPRALRLAARYKCSACSAARLSAQGCPIMRIATIAWTDPCTCTTAGPSRTSPAA